MKNKKGFDRKVGVLVIDINMVVNEEFKTILNKKYISGDFNEGYNRYYSEFDPDTKQDYSNTFTQANLEQYWKDQTNDNEYNGSLDSFIKDYNLQLDVWFINCGYDFKGVKEIILDY